MTYLTSADGKAVVCGTDSAGNQLAVQLVPSTGDQPVIGGEVAGFQIGGAVLLVMAVAWGVRQVANVLNDGGGGER
ncbi:MULTISPECIES: hypothetical protein [Burkholderia cepacia complex]|uniref:hypothetical protein n=1 Tax=Burkholderia cepacia complex TaxID=87882 RepID=UPI001CF2AB7A|nr:MULTISPECIES: hypothetical protein [Burkholderia cepacia complex]MCA8094475.1 hypothetical protein [Burkholderia anthina]MDN7616608.1 hypothetical protein [Burkholderia cepacia]